MTLPFVTFRTGMDVMALPTSLVQHIEQHACMSGCYGSDTTIQLCLDAAKPLQPMVSVTCLDCLSRFGVPTALLTNGSSAQSLSAELTQHMRAKRGFALAVSGYHTGGPGFWLTAMYYACGLFLISGDRSRQLGSDLDQLLLAIQHGVIKPPDPRMADSKQFAVETAYVNFDQCKATIRNKAELLASPHCRSAAQTGWKKVTLAEFLPLTRVVAAPAKPAAPKPLVKGDICPKCKAEVRDRPLLNRSYLGCLC